MELEVKRSRYCVERTLIRTDIVQTEKRYFMRHQKLAVHGSVRHDTYRHHSPLRTAWI